MQLIEQYLIGNVTEAILLLNANTGDRWFQQLWSYPICFVDHRIKFIPGAGVGRMQPTKNNCFVYFGNRAGRFEQIFSRFGRVIGTDRRDTDQGCGRPAVSLYLPEEAEDPFQLITNPRFQAMPKSMQRETLLCFAAALVVEAKRLVDRMGEHVH